MWFVIVNMQISKSQVKDCRISSGWFLHDLFKSKVFRDRPDVQTIEVIRHNKDTIRVS